jgi:hypothetical protein
MYLPEEAAFRWVGGGGLWWRKPGRAVGKVLGRTDWYVAGGRADTGTIRLLGCHRCSLLLQHMLVGAGGP